jgi:hypothetical protein
MELQTSVKQDDTTRTPKPGYLNLSNIFLLALGMEIMKYTLENIFNLSYYGVNNNTT